jgi:hypothetical protein
VFHEDAKFIALPAVVPGTLNITVLPNKAGCIGVSKLLGPLNWGIILFAILLAVISTLDDGAAGGFAELVNARNPPVINSSVVPAKTLALLYNS